LDLEHLVPVRSVTISDPEVQGESFIKTEQLGLEDASKETLDDPGLCIS